ncbi:chlorite dismutase family protein [uncultured Hymenobacter sp.]|uniref:chlorite dismutase family protein n=1 Tax=uncultured Hymenobacter sp. TaxID=170016 RepID=UPI0035C9B629
MNHVFDFIGGPAGPWQVVQATTLVGDSLPPVSHLQRQPSPSAESATVPAGSWALRGLISNLRYAERVEKMALVAVQAPLGRAAARCAALIPLRKSAAWWELAQDERRAIFEAASHHTQTGLKYLPAIARQLYHCRDLGGPFDFLTWFEYAPADSAAFEDLVGVLRQTEEWTYVDREVDLRLVRL